MENRDDQMIIRLTKEEKIKILDAVGDRETTISQMIREALDLYLEIPPDFFKGIKTDADEYKVSVGTFVAHLLTAYTSMTAAMVVEDIKTPIFNYAFRITDKGMMDAHEMGVKTFQEVQAKIREIKERANRAKRTKKEVVLDDTAKGLLSYALHAGGSEPVKAEAKYTPMARAKAAK